jgi:hypothetical protein
MKPQEIFRYRLKKVEQFNPLDVWEVLEDDEEIDLPEVFCDFELGISGCPLNYQLCRDCVAPTTTMAWRKPSFGIGGYQLEEFKPEEEEHGEIR